MGYIFRAGGGESMNGFKQAGIIFALHMIIGASGAYAQSRTLAITSNVSSAHVYLDSQWLGLVSQAPFDIPLNASKVTVMASREGLWSVDPLLFDLSQQADGAVSLIASFPYTYRVESIPSGARVFNDSGIQLGFTPLQWESVAPVEQEFTVSLAGHAPVTAQPGNEVWNRHMFALVPLTPGEGVATRGIMSDRPKRRWINKVTLTSALAAGALAVHFRTKADNRFDDYNQTGNQALRDEIRRLDIRSGVALGAMQLGVGVVAIRLAF